MLKKILLAVALALPMLASAQTVKFGVCDTNAIISLMPETTAAQNQINEVSKKYDSEYQKLGEEYKRKVDEFQNMKEDELPAIKERKTRELQDYQQKIQQFEQTAMQDLQKLQNDLMAPIMTKLRNAIEAVGQEGNFTVIEDKTQMLLYVGSTAVDVTNDVKNRLGLK